MNTEFKNWLEKQTYEWPAIGMWSVINEEYNNKANYNWYDILQMSYRYKILQQARQLNL